MFFISWNKLVFSAFFLFPEINCFFSEIGNKFNARSGQKKNTCFSFGNALPKSNVRTEKKNLVALHCCIKFAVCVVSHQHDNIWHIFSSKKHLMNNWY